MTHRSSRPSSADSRCSIETATGKRRKRKDTQMLVWLPEGMNGWTQKDLDDNDPIKVLERQQHEKIKRGKYLARKKNRSRPPSANGRKAEIDIMVPEDNIPSAAPPPTEVILALNSRGTYLPQKGMYANKRKWKKDKKRRRILKSAVVQQEQHPSYRYDHKQPMSLNDQKSMEKDATKMGKIWFRTVRNVPVGMTEREQVKA